MPITINGTGTVAGITAGGLPDGCVATADIADANVTQAKLAANVAGNGPAFHACAGTTTSLPAASATKINLNTEIYDTNSNFASSRFTATVAGYYQFNGAVGNASGVTMLLAMLSKNGTLELYGNYSAASTYLSNVSGLLYLGAGDYVELFGYSATSSTVAASGLTTYLTGFLARAA
jgi:hypothetical protein